ncbi:DNA kinase/phosphatase Pnk1 [Metarhizium album ARSEF 1941]|uniref:DNA kinase/phosphatase Pnk1 n=1 Tax=Metarhizium album (strain ARSEF 1941) TaxID=1081103 RepID=A0A0B2WER7_METAS|nr:DNA kinase/phosphatase Pnk1 [Metarhizium album ARSEF 1941]KHN94351.1 DNA kinase/phosphatase Pnk1 [Metarhizium album ARSEF 1941]
MAPPPSTIKRKAEEAPISPPPIKRSLQSTTTKSAVANFFTPTSQKPKDRTTWSERGPSDDVPATLLVGRYVPDAHVSGKKPKKRIAAFDLDSTLIVTSSGKKHAGDGRDWKWWHPHVPGILQELSKEKDYQVVILSNQGGLALNFDPSSKGPKGNAQKRVADFKQKCSAILASLDIPTTIYAATERDGYRKPNTEMWKEVCEDYDIPENEVDLKHSFFVGDAGGRVAGLGRSGGDGAASKAKDFSCSDRNFAHNVGIAYKTPEEYFLGESPRDFVRDFDVAKFPFDDGGTLSDGLFHVFERKNDKDVVLFCGPPGAGKSTFFWRYLKPLGYERVNQDTLKSRDKCLQAAKELLLKGSSVAVDNTNADPDTRALWVEVASKAKVPIRCVWFKTPLYICEHNDAVRAHNRSLNPEARPRLPKLAFTGFSSRYKAPQSKEGFQDIVEVDFRFMGTKEEHASPKHGIPWIPGVQNDTFGEPKFGLTMHDDDFSGFLGSVRYI